MFPSGFYCMLNSSWQTFTCFFTPSSWHQSCSHWSAFWDRFLSNNQPPRPCIWFDFTFVWFGLSFDFRCALKNTVLFAKCILLRKMCMEVCKYSYGGVSCLISLNDPVYDVLQIRSQKLFQFMFCSRFLFYWETRSQCVAWFSTHVGSSMSPRYIEFATFDINFIICTLTPYILKVGDPGVWSLDSGHRK